MNGYGIRSHLQALLHQADLHLVVGIGAQGCGCAHVHNQTNISTVAAMSMPDHSLLLENGIGPTLGHLVYHFRQVDQSLDRADGYAVIQWNYDCVPAVSVHYPFNSNSLANLTQIVSSRKC